MTSVEMWKLRRLVKKLQRAEGSATSMISLVIPPGSQISQAINMLNVEVGTAENIKSRVNKLSVLSAITSVIQKLKLYTRVPKNGLVVYCGTITTEDGKEKKVIYDIEPYKPINTSLYRCDNKFHTDVLSDLLEDARTYGIIVMDGLGTMYAKLNGNTKTIIHSFVVDLPKKHGRGGQSALRFSRLRTEKRHNYVRKVAEEAARIFLSGDKVNVDGIILAGLAQFKEVLSGSDLFDSRLRDKIISIVDVAYGGESGLNQAIELSQGVLDGVKLIEEQSVINDFFDSIRLNNGMVCYGIRDTMKALEAQIIDRLIIHEDSTLPSPDPAYDTLVEYLVEKDLQTPLDKRNMTLCLVSDRTQEGAQFVNGFGGVGGIMKYQYTFDDPEEQMDLNIEFNIDDYV